MSLCIVASGTGSFTVAGGVRLTDSLVERMAASPTTAAWSSIILPRSPSTTCVVWERSANCPRCDNRARGLRTAGVRPCRIGGVGFLDALVDRLLTQRADVEPPFVTLIVSGGHTLLIAMEYPQAQMNGPPFSVSGGDVESLYAPNHTIRELARRDILASEPRLRARGVTELTEVCYHLTRMGG